MKIVSLLLSLCIASVTLAEDPAELVKLRATYDNSLRSDFQKVGKLYHGRLVELKENCMEAKNLEAAVAVDAEIKKLRDTHGKMVVKVSEPQEAFSPLDGAWLAYSNKKPEKYLRVFSRGFMAIGQEGGRILKWSLKNGIVVIDFGLPQRWEKLIIDPNNPAVMTGVNNAGWKVTYERVKW